MTFFAQLLQYGTTPTLLVLSVLVLWLIKKLDENGKKDEKRNAALGKALSDKIDAIEEKFEKRFAATDQSMKELADRVSCVERDYLPREEHYKEFSGWRAEINRLYDLIVDLFKEGKKT